MVEKVEAKDLGDIGEVVDNDPMGIEDNTDAAPETTEATPEDKPFEVSATAMPKSADEAKQLMQWVDEQKHQGIKDAVKYALELYNRGDKDTVISYLMSNLVELIAIVQNLNSFSNQHAMATGFIQPISVGKGGMKHPQEGNA